MGIINDEVLGTLIFNRGWTKEENFLFWDHEFNLKLIVSAYENEVVNINQQSGYLNFKKNIEHISDISLMKTKEYINVIKDEILPYINLNEIPEDVLQIIKPGYIMILESGNIGIVFNCAWDNEHGIAILIDNKQNVEVGPEDIIWE